MRVLILSKRQYTNLDLIDDRFGRLRELPLALASAGHEVTGVCLSYRFRDEGRCDDIQGETRVIWHSLNWSRLLSLGSGSYWQKIDEIGSNLRPDLVWACSDVLHAILGVRVARKLGAALIIDLYDNFESFTASRFPGLVSAFRRALRCADGITCVSHPLAQYVREKSSCQCPIEVIENAVPEGLFHPMDQDACRRELALPADALLIGMAGAISRSRGVDILFQAFEKIARERMNVHLILAGTLDKGMRLPRNHRVHYLGMLPPTAVPVFLSALDVSVVCNRASAFGNYCFPQKFYESVACGVPIVSAGVGVLKTLLRGSPDHLYEPGNVRSLTAAIQYQMEQKSVLQIDTPTWQEKGGQLKNFFELVLDGILTERVEISKQSPH